MTQEEAVNAVTLMIDSLSNQVQKFPGDIYLLVSLEIAQHLANYGGVIAKPRIMYSGDEFHWKGQKCKVA